MKTLSHKGWSVISDMDKLTGPNFLEWFTKLKTVLIMERLVYVLEEPVPEEPLPDASTESRDAYKAHMSDLRLVTNLMLHTLAFPIFIEHAGKHAHDIYVALDDKYNYMNHHGRHGIFMALNSMTMKEGDSIKYYLFEKMRLIIEYTALGGILSMSTKKEITLLNLPKGFDEIRVELYTMQPIPILYNLYSRPVRVGSEILNKVKFVAHSHRVYRPNGRWSTRETSSKSLRPAKKTTKVWLKKQRAKPLLELERMLRKCVQVKDAKELEDIKYTLKHLKIKD